MSVCTYSIIIKMTDSIGTAAHTFIVKVDFPASGELPLRVFLTLFEQLWRIRIQPEGAFFNLYAL